MIDLKDMKPADLLVKRVEEFLLQPMQEMGFRFSKTHRTFKRKIDPFTQVISFELRSKNEEDSCRFSMGFDVTSREYARWYQEMWGEPPPSDSIWAGNEWNIPNWPRKTKKKRFGLFASSGKGLPKDFHLTNSEEDKEEMMVLRAAIEGPALEHLDRVTSWEGAAQGTWSLYHTRIVGDLYMIAGDKAKARQVIEDGIQEFEASNDRNKEQFIADLKERRSRYFSGN